MNGKQGREGDIVIGIGTDHIIEQQGKKQNDDSKESIANGLPEFTEP
jgi:hypothetical protein